MKGFTVAFFLFGAIVCCSCSSHKNPMVSAVFIDSLIKNYDTPQAIKANSADIEFWKNRITPGDFSNAMRYAAALITRFHISGNIDDVIKADSIFNKTAADFKGKEAGPYYRLVGNYVLQHRFKEADSVLQLANSIGLKAYEYQSALFDVNFELGYFTAASANLSAIKKENDYGYQFRKSRWAHYSSGLDPAIAAMQNAEALAGSNEGLKSAALSNLGDMYVHAGKLEKAAECYTRCIKINAADMHSITGLGWLALCGDGNDSLAEKIFLFVKNNTKAPDILYRLVTLAQYRNDTAGMLHYANSFAEKASQPVYGNMYNKYLIELYSGILQKPEMALQLSERELQNRHTPQTSAWYAFALLKNGRINDAMDVYQKYISGKPLEAPELYYMGKLMQAAGKGYNAKQYFKEAAKNKYDVMPWVRAELL